MSFRVTVRPVAEDDIADAAAWYEKQRAGLGAEFVAEVAKRIDFLASNPLITPRQHRRRNIRWSYPERFPYRIVFEIVVDTVTVFAVQHAARREGSWRERL